MATVALEVPSSDTSIVGDLSDDGESPENGDTVLPLPATAAKRRGSAMEFFSERRDTAVSKQNTEQLVARKRELSDKLAHDERKLRALKEGVSAAKERMSSVVGILDSIDGRLVRLEKTILPVHERISALSITQENILRTNAMLLNVISSFDVCDEVGDYIRDYNKTAEVATYINQLERADGARAFFDSNKLQGGAAALEMLVCLKENRSLVSTGVRSLTERYAENIVQYGFYGDLRGYIDGNEEIDVGKELDKLLIDAKVVDKLREIAKYLTEKQHDTRYEKYHVDARSERLAKTLASMSQDVSNVASSGNLLVPGSAGRDVAAKLTQRLGAKATGALGRTQSTMGMGIGGVSFDAFGKTSTQESYVRRHANGLWCGTNAAVTLKWETKKRYRKGTHPYLVVVDIANRLLLFTPNEQQEKRLCNDILPNEESLGRVYDSSSYKMVEILANTGEVVIRDAQKVTGDKTYIFDIIGCLTGDAFDRTTRLFAEKSQCATRIEGLVQSFLASGNRVLQDADVDLKRTPVRPPPDGTVHEMTSNIMNFLSRVYVYKETAELVLRNSSVKESEENMLGAYISQLAMTLQISLQSKAATYSDKTLACIFLLNNFHYILKTMQGAAFHDLLGSGFDRIFEGVVDAQINAYKQTWTACLNYIRQYPSDPNLKFSTRSLKDEMKDRYKGFNAEFENIVNRHTTYTVPDEALKQRLQQITTELVVPEYKAFRQRADTVTFTNPQKYVKYSVQSVQIMLGRLFNSAQ